MSTQYWISNVGGVCYVGRSEPAYSGQEYVSATDDDTQDYLAGLYEEDTLEGLWDTEDALEGVFSAAEKDPTYQAIKRSEAAIARMKKTIAKVRAKGDAASVKRFTALLETMQKTHAGLLKIPGAIALLKEKEAAGKRAAKKAKESSGPFGFVADVAGKIGGDMVFALNSVVALPGKAVKETLGQIPLIGGPIQAVVNLTPDQALSGLTSRVLSGERLDKAFLKTGKEQLKAIREVAPYVQTVMTFVPGVGTGVAAAIAAGTALAEGRTITEAVIEGVKGSAPGGQLGRIAIDSALAITKGQRLDKAAMAIAMKQLPAETRKAVEVAIAAAKGKDVKDAALQALRAQLPKDVQKALEIGIAVGAGRNIQSTLVSKVAQKSAVELLGRDGAKILAKAKPAIKNAATGLSAPKLAGFKVAIGAASKAGNNAHAMAALRAKLGKPQRAGFDHGIKTLVNKANPHWVSLVKGGKVLRGNFKQVAKGTPGAISGRIVRGNKVVIGHWAR